MLHKVKDLVEEVQRLRAETDALSLEAYKTVATRWYVNHSELFPKLCNWQNELNLKTFSTFSFEEGSLVFQPMLSDGNSFQFENIINKKNTDDNLSEEFGTDAYLNIELSMSGNEMHIDFSQGILFIPLTLLDECCGVIIAKANDLDINSYKNIADTTALMLDMLRFNLFSRLREMNPLARKAS